MISSKIEHEATAYSLAVTNAYGIVGSDIPLSLPHLAETCSPELECL